MLRTIVTLIVVLSAANCNLAAFATETPPGPAKPVRELVSHQCAQLARRILHVIPAGSDEQSELAQAFLQEACRIDPDNPETWRLLTEAADLTGDDAQVVDALKQYLRLRPDDDAAQLRLIDELIGRQQTVDQRLSMYERMIDSPQAQRFTAALRSRLAYRAAMLHAEQGNRQDMARRLTQALELDPTNKAAARQAYTELVDGGAALDEIAAALFTLHSADPADPSTRAMIGDLMLRCGHYAGAVDWYNMAVALQKKNGGPLSTELAQNMVLALWGVGHTTEALGVLDDMATPPPIPAATQPGASAPAPATAPTNSAPATAAPPQQSPNSSGTSPAQNPPPAAAAQPAQPAAPAGKAGSDTATAAPKRIDLPIDLEMIRLAMLDNADQAKAADALFDKLIVRLKDLAKQAPQSTALQANLAWTCLLFNRQVAILAVPTVQAMAKAQADPSPTLRLLQGWLALRRGDQAHAAELLKPLVDTDARARLGWCLLDSVRRDTDQLYTQLNGVAVAAPSSIVGLMAVDQIRALQRQPTWPKRYLRAIEPFTRVPDTLRQLVARPMSFVMLREHMASVRQYTYPQSIPLQLELRNVSQLPLALGSEGTIPTRVMIFPTVRLFGKDSPPNLPPMVVDLNRRLRLMPGQSLQVPVRLDNGQLGLLLDGVPGRVMRLNALVMLNPTLSPAGGFRPGVLGASLSIRGIIRQPALLKTDAIDQQLAVLGGPDTLDNLRTAGLLVKMVCLQEDGKDKNLDKVRQALIDQFPGMPPLRQAWLISQLVPNDNARQRLGPLLNRAANSPDHVVRYILLSQMADSPTSPWINAALRSKDLKIRRFATALKAFILHMKELTAEQEKQADNQNTETAPSGQTPVAPGSTPLSTPQPNPPSK